MWRNWLASLYCHYMQEFICNNKLGNVDVILFDPKFKGIPLADVRHAKIKDAISLLFV